MLHGGGLLDDSDLVTHQTIIDISYADRRLIHRFGSRFAILKSLNREFCPLGNLRSCWNPPTYATKEEVRQGTATFEQLMQI